MGCAKTCTRGQASGSFQQLSEAALKPCGSTAPCLAKLGFGAVREKRATEDDIYHQ